jgi:hypothetical protein
MYKEALTEKWLVEGTFHENSNIPLCLLPPGLKHRTGHIQTPRPQNGSWGALPLGIYQESLQKH